MTDTHPDIDYANKIVLAPMVRIGTLPMRLLALEYGADLVWTEELVDKRIIGSVRQYNKATGTVDYRKGSALTFSTHPNEKGKVILQLGTADPDLALKAALTLKQDVAGVDLNCGCPKKFSVQGGMGAALLTDPDRLKKILENLVQHSGMPVSCKIRLLETQQQTIELVKMIAATGVKALTVHCRTREMRPSQKAQWDRLKEVVEAVKSVRDIPVIVNGDVWQWSDVEKVKELTNADSAMIARGAQLNPSAFRKEGLLSFHETVHAYMKKCIDVDNVFQNSKYAILCMNTDDSEHTRSDLYNNLQRSKSTEALCDALGLKDYYEKVTKEHRLKREEDDKEAKKGEKREREEVDEEKERKKIKS
ncbi:hypothetical protein G6F57_004535 [Rhizopus arrhizus]|uniref:DUS-like FMN-binding domain-containing protein n=1 Tax=Rhizopus oryzae TaxID=64495 RepID=A0A9P6XGD4_RHIOR|nr:hypothetical protein G6F23_001128 [Rhizopus arrhizus]KAG1414172.1 hypothetical protein G6F58_007092 [Rhizopus delemar]KAG0765246.1 hypothetical protein G6F24_004577 [Rhizopus arrhizus]KAG0792080.1 hypothetical protein G6F21_004615 [Rhizopus arrhizus]KAG0795168.1 hypothetical protein G6F22_005176 [Rhizopus arrhizus]